MNHKLILLNHKVFELEFVVNTHVQSTLSEVYDQLKFCFDYIQYQATMMISSINSFQ